MKNDNLFSIEAEQAVLGGIICDGRTLDNVSGIINARDFYQQSHQIIFASMESMSSASEVIDIISLAEKIQRDGNMERVSGFDYLTGLGANATGSANLKAYAQIIADRARLRRLKDLLTECLEISTSAKSADEAIEFAQSKIIGMDSESFDIEIQESNAVLKNMLKNLETRFQEKRSGIIPGISTGLPSLDARFNGMRDGHLIVLAARPSMGKSALAMQIAQDVAIRQKKGVLVFSLEMPTEELYERMTATQGSLSYGRIRNGDLLEDDWVKLSTAVSKLKDSSIRVVDAPSLHINQVRAYSRKAHKRNPIRLIIVDHINIMRGDGQNREREVATISGGLKALAKEIGCPVIALCQLNRDCETQSDKRPKMAHLRESGAIEQDADIVSFLYRDDYYNENSPQKGVIEVITRKFRGGECGTDCLVNRLDIMTMSEMDRGYQNVEPLRKQNFSL